MSNSPTLNAPQSAEPQYVDIRVQFDGKNKYIYKMLEKVELPVTTEKLNSLLFETNYATSRKLNSLKGTWEVKLDELASDLQVTDTETSYDAEQGRGFINEDLPLLHYNMFRESISERGVAGRAPSLEEHVKICAQSARISFEKMHHNTSSMAEIMEVKKYADKLNPSIASKGGFCITLGRSETMRIRLDLHHLGASYAVRVFVNGVNAKTGLQPEVQVASNVRDYTPLHYIRNKAILGYYMTADKEACEFKAAPQGGALNDEYYSFEVDIHKMLVASYTTFSHFEDGEMKYLNSILTPKELRMKKGTSMLLRDWNTGKGYDSCRTLSEIDASTPQKAGMIHVMARYRKTEGAGGDEDDEEPSEEEEYTDRLWTPKGTLPHLTTKAMMDRVQELRVLEAPAKGTKTPDDPLHPRVYDTTPMHKIHIHVLSERHFKAVASAGMNLPGVSYR